MWMLLQKQIGRWKIGLLDDTWLTVLKKHLYEKNWNVYVKNSLAGPQSVVQYLGRYIHRVAICNSRIVSIDSAKVTFRWKDYRKGYHSQLLSLDAAEFIGRFMRHVLPSGFYKIRYYGILAAASWANRQKCVVLINKPLHVLLLTGLSAKQILKLVTGKDPDTCPKCKDGKMLPHTIMDPV